MSEEHIIEYHHYTSPEFKGEGYWGLEHPDGCSLILCPVNKALEDPPEQQGRYRVSVGSLRMTKVEETNG